MSKTFGLFGEKRCLPRGHVPLPCLFQGVSLASISPGVATSRLEVVRSSTSPYCILHPVGSSTGVFDLLFVRLAKLGENDSPSRYQGDDELLHYTPGIFISFWMAPPVCKGKGGACFGDLFSIVFRVFFQILLLLLFCFCSLFAFAVFLLSCFTCWYVLVFVNALCFCCFSALADVFLSLFVFAFPAFCFCFCYLCCL